VVRLFARINAHPQRETFEIINGGSGRGTTVAEIAGMLVENWGGEISVRYSGSVRAGDPFSLLADDARLRGLPFDWQIPVGRGIGDYVRWFKDQVR
jgi:UDP-glucose 4-epimerase